MAHRKTLTEKQLSVLRWIDDGCPNDAIGDDNAARVSAAALRRRGFVETSGHGPTWTAKTTAAGKAYLEQAAGPNAPIPRQVNTSVTEQLVNDVIAAGGSLRVPRTNYLDPDGIDYHSRAQLAERHGKVPKGQRLVVNVTSMDEIAIELIDLPPDMVLELNPVPVPDKVACYHAVVKQFKNDDLRHEVSRAMLPRALRVLQGLVVEAERRGYAVETSKASDQQAYGRPTWSGAQQGHLSITVKDCATAVRVKEEGLQSRAYWEAQNQTVSYRLDKLETTRSPFSEYEKNATGQLSLELVPNYRLRGRAAKWSDRKSWTLEEKLPELFREIELRAVEHLHDIEEAERKASERQVAWEAAMVRARELYAEKYRANILLDEVARWRDAQQIRSYCDAAQAAHPDDPGSIEWIAWARRYADELDPLQVASRMPDLPESVDPRELQPFLDGWSPYGPNR